MRNLFSTKVKIILVVAALLTAALAIYSGISNQSLPSVIVQGVLAPFRAAGTTLTNTAEKYYSYMFRYEALDAENKVLEERIAQMEDVARQADSVSRENERLRKLLELKATNEDYKLVDAYIQCLCKERRFGQPADSDLKAKRETASGTLDKAVTDCRKRFSSFAPSGA